MMNYMGLHAVREHLKASESEIDRQIDKMLESSVRTIPITGRPTQADDEIILDYAGEIDGEFFDGGTAQKQALVLGSGTFIPGFEEQLIGKSIGDEVDVKVTFPEKYHAEALAGREAVFHCKIHEIHLKEKYKADDVFAHEVGGCNSFDEFREKVRQSMQAYIDHQADDEVKDRLLSQLTERCEIQPTEEELEHALDAVMDDLENQLARQGLSTELYCQFMKKSYDALREEQRPVALKNLQRGAVIDEIAKAEGITATEAAVAQAIEEICRKNRMSVKQLEPYMTPAFQAAIEKSVVTAQVLDLLLESAEIETVEK